MKLSYEIFALYYYFFGFIKFYRFIMNMNMMNMIWWIWYDFYSYRDRDCINLLLLFNDIIEIQLYVIYYKA